MNRIKALAATSIVAVVATTGGPAFAKPLSEAQWKKQANAVCKQANKDIEDLNNEVFSGLDEHEQPSPEQVTAWVDRFAPIARKTIATVDALNEPTALRSTVKKLKAAISAAIEEIETDPVAAFSYEHDPFAKVTKIAKKLDLKACANG